MKRTRQLRIRPSPEPPLKVESSKPGRSSSAKSITHPTSRTPEKTRGKAHGVSVCKKKDSLSASADACPTVSAAKRNDTQAIVSPVRIPSSSQSAPFTSAIGPSMSDLDSDSDELYLPAVSEAIRMLDLDSQASPNNENSSGPSQNTLPTPGPLRLPISLLSANNVSGSSWPSVGYCSSLLQQFVAKSQSGEPPPPPPTLMLPTKGARKCFPPNDEPLPSIIATSSDSRSVKRAIDATRSSSFATLNNASISASVGGGHADQELDMMVPMRGLDCHQSHVSPDSGIQSVSGSPFSVHSSPVHPSGAGCNNNQTDVQPQPLVVSPCPPIPSPSPPLRQKKTNRKSGSNKKNSTTKNQDVSFPTATKVKSSGSRQNGSRSRRPRSCRDTASALSSGLGKDSSIVQAIQRGMNAALRLKNKDTTEEDTCPTDALASVPSASPEKSSRKKRCTKKKQKSGNDKSKEPIKTVAPVVEKDPSSFRNEAAAKLHSTTNKGGDEDGMIPTPSSQQQQSKLISESKVSTTRSPSPRHSKRKKKRKKHKNSVHDQVNPIPVDPSLLSTLDLLCRRLDRCIISRSAVQSVPVSCDKRPWVFQCRKYAITNGANTSGNGRTKRKKLAEDVHPNVTTAVKRKGKPKKTGSQAAPINTTSNSETTRGDEPVAAASATVALSAVELLLPLKKRHHHLATSDTPVVESVPTDVHHCESAIEKPSQEPILTKVAVNQPQQANSRKRTANSESTTEPAESKGFEQGESKSQVTTVQKGKKGRGHKKAKIDGIADVIAAVASATDVPVPVLTERAVMEKPKSSSTTPTPVQVEGDIVGDHLAKKKSRRRKTFNRTGFPSVKKKRKKLPSPVPPPLSLPQPPCNKPEADSSANNTTPRQAKRAKMMPKEEDEEAILPEPTSSEAASGDESNPMLPLPSIKGSQPKKRRNSTMRKRYLPAGLLSNYFKEDTESSSTITSVPAEKNKMLTYEPEEHEHGLLPPPFYCERFLRRTRRDFQLPFDVWWLHQQGKLPGRDNLVPSWNYRKIRSNVYYDVKPPFTNDAEPCNCTLPPPDAKG